MPGKRQARRVKLKASGRKGLVHRKELLVKNGEHQKIRNEKILKERHFFWQQLLAWKRKRNLKLRL